MAVDWNKINQRVSQGGSNSVLDEYNRKGAMEGIRKEAEAVAKSRGIDKELYARLRERGASSQEITKDLAPEKVSMIKEVPFEMLNIAFSGIENISQNIATPIAGLFASVPGGVTPKQAMSESWNMAKDLFYRKTEAGETMLKAGQQYLEKRGVGKYGGKKADIADIGVLTALAIFETFGHPATAALDIAGFQEARALKNLAKIKAGAKNVAKDIIPPPPPPGASSPPIPSSLPTINPETKLLKNVEEPLLLGPGKEKSTITGEGFEMTSKVDKNKLELAKKWNEYNDLVKSFNQNPTPAKLNKIQKLRKELKKDKIIEEISISDTNSIEISPDGVRINGYKQAVPSQASLPANKLAPETTDLIMTAKEQTGADFTAKFEGDDLILKPKIEPSVVQIVDVKTGKIEYKTIPEGQLDDFIDLIDDTSKGIAGKEIDGKIYHLTSKSPDAMERAGAKFAGEATFKDIPGYKPKLSPELDPLYSEARKYKSVEEFVGYQSKFYRGAKTNELGRGTTDAIWISPDKSYAEMYGSVSEFYIPNIKELNLLDAYSSKAKALLKEYTGKPLKQLPETDGQFEMLREPDQSFIDFLKNKGYEGIDNDPNIAIFNPKQIKTKSQLTDIWNEANKATKTGEQAVSKTAKDIEKMAVEKGLAKEGEFDLGTYTKMKMADEATKAEQLIKTNKEGALKSLDTLPETDLRRGDIYKTLRKQAIEENDIETITRLAKTSAGSEEAQALKAFDTLDPKDPVKTMRKVVKDREKAFTERTGKTVKEAVKQEVKTAKMSKWSDFVKSIECA